MREARQKVSTGNEARLMMHHVARMVYSSSELASSGECRCTEAGAGQEGDGMLTFKNDKSSPEGNGVYLVSGSGSKLTLRCMGCDCTTAGGFSAACRDAVKEDTSQLAPLKKCMVSISVNVKVCSWWSCLLIVCICAEERR